MSAAELFLAVLCLAISSAILLQPRGWLASQLRARRRLAANLRRARLRREARERLRSDLPPAARPLLLLPFVCALGLLLPACSSKPKALDPIDAVYACLVSEIMGPLDLRAFPPQPLPATPQP